MFNQKSTFTFNDWWRIMQNFRAWNAFSRISSQPESRGMPWSHFVAWLSVLSGSMISTSLLIIKILLQAICTQCNKTHLYFRGSSVSVTLRLLFAFICWSVGLFDSLWPNRIDCREKPSRLNLINSAPNLPEFVTIWPCPTAWLQSAKLCRTRKSSKIIDAWKLSSSCHATVRQSTCSPCTAWDRDLRGWQLASAVLAASLHLQWLKQWEQKPVQRITCFRSPALHDQAWGTIVVHLLLRSPSGEANFKGTCTRKCCDAKKIRNENKMQSLLEMAHSVKVAPKARENLVQGM